MKLSRISQSIAALTIATTAFMSTSALATIVEFQTNQGNFQVNLYDKSTPVTVDNFLTYVIDGDYTNVLVHRNAKEFVVQAGGYTFDSSGTQSIESNGTIINEAAFSNVRGTIAMAKSAGDPNSASSQWFFNLADNSANLDAQNGGFTAFGEVITDDINGDGMAVLAKITQFTNCQTQTFSNLPVPTADIVSCAEALSARGPDDLVIIENIIIIDSSEATADDLSPPLTTDTDHDGVLNDNDAFPEDPNESEDTDGDGVGDNSDAFPADPNKTEPEPDPTPAPKSSSGSMSWLSLGLLAAIRARRVFK